MPDKRQQSKQRRAARNRANREALAARRENAETSAVSPSASSNNSSSAGSRGAPRGPGARGAPAASGPLHGRPKGYWPVLASVPLAVAGAIFAMFYRVPADDRGEPLPVTFRGVAIEARERLTGESLPDNDITLLEARGPQLLLLLGPPVAVTLFAVWSNRRPDRSRMLTFAMLAMAGAVILTGGVFFYPALIALAVGGFLARRADLPARTAERATRGGPRRGRQGDDVIDVHAEEVVGEAGGSAAEVETETAPRGAGGPVDELDPLAELEAEIEAERAAEEEAEASGRDETGGDRGPERAG